MSAMHPLGTIASMSCREADRVRDAISMLDAVRSRMCDGPRGKLDRAFADADARAGLALTIRAYAREVGEAEERQRAGGVADAVSAEELPQLVRQAEAAAASAVALLALLEELNGVAFAGFFTGHRDFQAAASRGRAHAEDAAIALQQLAGEARAMQALNPARPGRGLELSLRGSPRARFLRDAGFLYLSHSLDLSSGKNGSGFDDFARACILTAERKVSIGKSKLADDLRDVREKLSALPRRGCQSG